VLARPTPLALHHSPQVHHQPPRDQVGQVTALRVIALQRPARPQPPHPQRLGQLAPRLRPAVPEHIEDLHRPRSQVGRPPRGRGPVPEHLRPHRRQRRQPRRSELLRRLRPHPLTAMCRIRVAPQIHLPPVLADRLPLAPPGLGRLRVGPPQRVFLPHERVERRPHDYPPLHQVVPVHRLVRAAQRPPQTPRDVLGRTPRLRSWRSFARSAAVHRRLCPLAWMMVAVALMPRVPPRPRSGPGAGP
jgi:hypothetical protein